MSTGSAVLPGEPDRSGRAGGPGSPAAADTGPGLITFSVGARLYATALTSVREVVRLVGLTDLDGMQPPHAGVVDLRGTCLPVLDLRREPAVDTGDLLVLDSPDGALVGVAVDRVRAVLDRAELPGSFAGAQRTLPSYVLGVLRGDDGPVFLVDLAQMARPRAEAQT